MHFNVVQSLSLAGELARANDDRAGAGDRHAWLIDGATDLGEPGLIGAAWIAAEADRAFATARDAPLADMCRAVFGAVAARYAAARTRDLAEKWEAPSAAFLAIALAGDMLDCAWLGDCTAVHITAAGAIRVGPPRDVRDREAAMAARLAHHGLGTPGYPAPILAELRTARERPDRRVLDVDARGADHIRFAAVAAAPGDEMLLMTDGFAALVDLYHLVTIAELPGLLASEGLHGIAARLRSTEHEDAGCRRWPRFKRGDDATALWLRIAG